MKVFFPLLMKDKATLYTHGCKTFVIFDIICNTQVSRTNWSRKTQLDGPTQSSHQAKRIAREACCNQSRSNMINSMQTPSTIQELTSHTKTCRSLTSHRLHPPILEKPIILQEKPTNNSKATLGTLIRIIHIRHLSSIEGCPSTTLP